MPRVRTIVATAAVGVLAATSVAWAQDDGEDDPDPGPVKSYADVANAFLDEARENRTAMVALWDQCYADGTEDDVRVDMQNAALHVIGLYDLAAEYAAKTIDADIEAEVADVRAAVDITSTLAADRGSMQRWYDHTMFNGLSACLTPEQAADRATAEDENEAG